MDGVDASRMWKSLKQRLGLKGMGCCGAALSPAPPTMTVTERERPRTSTRDDHRHHRDQLMVIAAVVAQIPAEDSTTTATDPSTAGMNLAMALAAERNSREGNEDGPNNSVKTLMRLIEETDGVDWKRRSQKGGGGCDGACCVCMDRCKGAAFIPCGHTFCRVCSRELWVNRGSCPVCNRSILEILDLF